MKVDECSQDFESNLAELELVVQQLESEVRLEHALTLFERGMKLSQACESCLIPAEQKFWPAHVSPVSLIRLTDPYRHQFVGPPREGWWSFRWVIR